jgi:hypothetical protein
MSKALSLDLRVRVLAAAKAIAFTLAALTPNPSFFISA